MDMSVNLPLVTPRHDPGTRVPLYQLLAEDIARLGAPVFGLMSDDTMLLAATLDALGSGFHGARHENSAIAMAEGYAAATGELGIALIGRGPAAANALHGAVYASRTGSKVLIVFGDGACGFGLSEFDTFARHGIAVIAVVGNDAGWTQIAREQVKMLKDDVGTVLARTAYHEVARGFGAEGLLVKRADEVDGALKRARELARQGRPVLVNVWLDRTEFREGSLSM
jgi:thiamine pyrophosphate-dependent acetolactate synthase large subunit-like protein